jgi:hypothetical protein
MRLALRLTVQTAIFSGKTTGTQLAMEDAHAPNLGSHVDAFRLQLELREFE